jgi:hypothetical protein
MAESRLLIAALVTGLSLVLIAPPARGQTAAEKIPVAKKVPAEARADTPGQAAKPWTWGP